MVIPQYQDLMKPLLEACEIGKEHNASGYCNRIAQLFFKSHFIIL